MKPKTAFNIVLQIREWLKLGAIIKATTRDGKILEEEGGSVFGGITVDLSKRCAKCRGIGSVLPKGIWDAELVSCPDCDGQGYTFNEPVKNDPESKS